MRAAALETGGLLATGRIAAQQLAMAPLAQSGPQPDDGCRCPKAMDSPPDSGLVVVAAGRLLIHPGLRHRPSRPLGQGVVAPPEAWPEPANSAPER